MPSRSRKPNRAADAPSIDQAVLTDARAEERLQALDAALCKAGLEQTPRGSTNLRPSFSHVGRRSLSSLHCPAPRTITAENGVQWLPIYGWDEYPWLRAGFSTRIGGLTTRYSAEGEPPSLNLGLTADDDPELVLANRRLFAEALTGSAATPLIALKQIHSSLCLQATAASAERSQPFSADAQFTTEPNLLLAVQTADCVPVLVADRRQRIVAAFHAGWRGTVRRIVQHGVGQLRLACNSRPEDLIAAIGPAAAPCCYSVGEELYEEFTSQFTYANQLFHRVRPAQAAHASGQTSNHPAQLNLHLDLFEANRRQLLAAGLKPQAIRVVGGCTNCHPELFYSHRLSKGRAGRLMAAIGVFPE